MLAHLLLRVSLHVWSLKEISTTRSHSDIAIIHSLEHTNEMREILWRFEGIEGSSAQPTCFHGNYCFVKRLLSYAIEEGFLCDFLMGVLAR